MEANFSIRSIIFEKESRLSPSRYSSLTRLVRVNAWVSRFIENCQTTKNKRRKRELTVEELSDSENSIIRGMQETAFRCDIEALKKNKNVCFTQYVKNYPHEFNSYL